MLPIQRRLLDHILKSLFVVAMLLGLQSPAWAFKLSPCLRVLTMEDGELSQEKIRWWNLCGSLDEQYTSAVHEHMTLAAIRKYRGDGPLEINQKGWKYQYMIEPAWRQERVHPFHQTHAIIYGSWWNDDPLMRTWGQGIDFLGGANDDRKMLKSGRKTYPGGRADCSVPADQHLGRWSHFGKLQHLHFMTGEYSSGSTAEERVRSTTDKALTWIAFAYRVATGELKPEDQLSADLEKQAGLPSIAENECVKPKNVKIWTVFSRIGWDEPYRIVMTPDVALGSILHVLQDSWSPSHTCRIEEQVDGQQVALLKDVFNYAEQTKSKRGKREHSAKDQYPQWLIDEVVHGQRKYNNDPVAVGAWVLAAVDQRLPWDTVEAYLRKTIYAPANTLKSTNDACIH